MRWTPAGIGVSCVLLAAAAPAAAATPEQVRADRLAAQAILDERRFRGTRIAQPLRSPLDWLGDVVQRGLEAVVRHLPGGAPVGWAVLAALVLALAGALAGARVRRLAAREQMRAALAVAGAGEDPRALERAADAAERDGDAAQAIRLRFRAGLLELAGAGRIELGPGMTTGAVLRQLPSSRLEAICADFDAVAYGRRRALTEDAARAREGWAALRAELGLRRGRTPALAA